MGRQFVTARTRAVITVTIRRGIEWDGYRHGIRMKFRINENMEPECERIVWEARIGGTWRKGKSPTVLAAINAVEDTAHELGAPL